MPGGINRPYTVSDIIGSLQGQIGAVTQGASTSAGTGFLAEDDETAGFADSVTATATAVTPEWGSALWGSLPWG